MLLALLLSCSLCAPLGALHSGQGSGAADVDASWERIQNLAPGEDRARALTLALPELGAAELERAYELGYEELVNQTRAYRMDAALPLARALHERARAPWSAMSLAIACTRSGASERAHAVLVEAVRRTPDGPLRYELLERLGLASLGAGHQARARRELGSAFARGSNNAGVVLGFLALREGRRAEARSLFRALLGRPPSQSWAHRGWGLSMVGEAANAVAD